MARIIVQNTSVLTLDDCDTFYYPGFVEVRKDVVYKIGSWSPGMVYEPFDGETVILDGSDKLVMPGLVDLHFHTSVAKVSS